MNEHTSIRYCPACERPMNRSDTRDQRRMCKRCRQGKSDEHAPEIKRVLGLKADYAGVTPITTGPARWWR